MSEKRGDKLKFLVKMGNVGILPMSPEESLKLTLATIDYWDSIMKSGKAIGGALADGSGGGGILEVESLEELATILAGAPNAGFTKYEVHGLTTLETIKMILNKQLEALKKGEK